MGKLDPERLDSLSGIFDPREKKSMSSRPSNPMEARMAEINAFHDEHGREPSADATGAERELAWSLQGFRDSHEKVKQLTPIDHHGLLTVPAPRPMTLEDALASDDPLFSDSYGLSDAPAEIDQDLLDRMEERRKGSRRITGEITERRRCEVFGVWKTAFAKLREDINAGRRRLIPTTGTRQVEKGDSFIVDGQISTIADILDVHDEVGLPRKRLRVVIDNGTEYEPYVESFSKALWRDPNSRRIAEPDGKMQVDGLFSQNATGVIRTGCIYAARTLGAEPQGYVDRMIKIGRTKNDPARRIANAAEDPTFLRQPARLIRQWDLVGYEPKDVEAALHAFFTEAALVQKMVDGFGKTVSIREWFDVEIEVVDEAVGLIMQRRIGQHRYDATARAIVTA